MDRALPAAARQRGRGWLPKMLTMLAIRRSRRRLLLLDDRLLDDVGLSRTEARREAATAAWDVPVHWRR